MPLTESPEIISFEQVSYAYPNRDRLALRDITLNVAQGEFLGVIGATGSGKSTFCLALNGIVPQFYGGRFFGHLQVAGLDTVDTPVNQIARRVGMVFEDPEMQITSVRVETEIAFAMENHGFSVEEMRRRIPLALQTMGLEGLEHRHPHELSGGQKQRLAIASALALQPDVLVLDEPASQLDPWAASALFRTLHSLHHESGITVIIASQAAELLADYADRLLVLKDGEVLAVDTPQAIYSDEALLIHAGVRAPQVTQIFVSLAHKGRTTSYRPVTLDEGLQALEQLINPALDGFVSTLDGSAPNSLVSGPTVLQAEHLDFAYGEDPRALSNVTLTLHAGEYVLLAGENGAGKTTLLKHFLGLLHPQKGKVTVDGHDIAGKTVAEIAQKIGYIGQNPDRQIFNNTVAEEVAFGLMARHLSRDEIRARVDKSLDLLGLTAKREAHPLSLPRGERTRVVIAAVLALEPGILVFDEPTLGQDYAGAVSLLELTRDLHRQGKTLLVVSHHLHLLSDYAQRAVVLHKGNVVFDGALRDAFYDTAMLSAAHLIPPQAVQLVQHFAATAKLPKLLTPDEIACFITDHAEIG